jgi:hypothetical protein
MNAPAWLLALSVPALFGCAARATSPPAARPMTAPPRPAPEGARLVVDPVSAPATAIAPDPAGAAPEAPFVPGASPPNGAGPDPEAAPIPRGALRAVLREHADELRRCALSQPEALGALFVIEFEVSSEGRVSRVDFGPGDPGYQACLRAVILRFVFPPLAPGARVIVRYPVRHYFAGQ